MSLKMCNFDEFVVQSPVVNENNDRVNDQSSIRNENNFIVNHASMRNVIPKYCNLSDYDDMEYSDDPEEAETVKRAYSNVDGSAIELISSPVGLGRNRRRRIFGTEEDLGSGLSFNEELDGNNNLRTLIEDAGDLSSVASSPIRRNNSNINKIYLLESFTNVDVESRFRSLLPIDFFLFSYNI